MKSTVMVTCVLATFSGTALADGAQLFKDKACWSCHGKDGKTPLMPGYPKIAGQDARYVENQIRDIKSGARANGNTAAMKLMLSLVSSEEIKALADFVSKLER
jgi:cytochrome c